MQSEQSFVRVHLAGFALTKYLRCEIGHVGKTKNFMLVGQLLEIGSLEMRLWVHTKSIHLKIIQRFGELREENIGNTPWYIFKTELH